MNIASNMDSTMFFQSLVSHYKQSSFHWKNVLHLPCCSPGWDPRALPSPRGCGFLSALCASLAGPSSKAGPGPRFVPFHPGHLPGPSPVQNRVSWGGCDGSSVSDGHQVPPRPQPAQLAVHLPVLTLLVAGYTSSMSWQSHFL